MTAGRTTDVHILRFPLRVFAQAQEHMDELLREFALLALRPPEHPAHAVPARLLALVEELTNEYAGINDVPDRVRDEALERGDEFVDLHYALPAEAADAAERLDAMLDEVDAYCRTGEHLLTLATPPAALAFRRWYLHEFVAQLHGGTATPWTAHEAVTT